MPGPPQTQVTQLIESAAAGDPLATDRLFPLVYAELRGIAASVLAGQAPSTLQPTALVNEAYLKLVGGADRPWDTRGHFFGAAARAMRQILVDHARRVKVARAAREKILEIGLPTMDSTAPSNAQAADDLLSIDTAMQSLLTRDERQHQVVMLRFFAGLTIEQTALAMGLSTGTIKNEWNYARAWLTREAMAARSLTTAPGGDTL